MHKNDKIVLKDKKKKKQIKKLNFNSALNIIKHFYSGSQD